MDTTRRLMRSRSDRMVAGVCGGIAARYGLDPSLVRILFVLVGLVTALVPLGLTYLFAWWLLPVAEGTAPSARRLHRSETDRMIGGVVGGIAETWGGDPTPLRLLAVFATLVTLVIPGVLTYLVAWVLVPSGRPRSEDRPEPVASA